MTVAKEPECARSMGCLCAGHARGNRASAPCDASEWMPEYEPWRHGGWYVTNVRYPSGAIGCVSRNYTDRKWRIVCESNGATYASRDAAARAERAIAEGRAPRR